MSRIRDIASILTAANALSTDTETAAAITTAIAALPPGYGRGNTASRPASPTVGDLYSNTETGTLEIYESTGWGSIISPSTVTSVAATNSPSGRAYNNGRASVAFTPGTFAGTTYTVTSTPGSYTASGSSSPVLVTGLQSSTQYTYTVVASSKYGISLTSSASTAVTATTVPQAPTIGAATAGNASATVAYTAGATGGSTITTFTATSSPGSLTGTGESPITVSGLTNGTAYTFTVTATNANGASVASSASSSVTPQAPTLVTALLVGGGGGGGVSLAGGGGGGAVMKTDSITLVNGTTYNVVIGAGAVGPTTGASVHYVGGSTTFNGITCTGGGNGASRDMGSTAYNNMSAGANGGGGTADGAAPSTLGKTGVAPTFPIGITGIVYAGYTGGNGGGGGNAFPGGGGAGSNANGQSPANNNSNGAGGNGIQINFDGNNWYWAGGGGGSTYTSGIAGSNGGLGGGGGGASANAGGTGGGSSINSGQTPASGGGNYDANRIGGNGGANSGGGGGAGSHGEGDGGNGGSGICIIKTASTASATTGSPTISSSEGYNYYRFTGTGSITF
jgi:hypothetical protein